MNKGLKYVLGTISKGILALLLCDSVLVLAATRGAGDAKTPEPGVTFVSGKIDENLLQLHVKPTQLPLGQIQAIKIFAEPSHTFLAAIVAANADIKTLIEMWAKSDGHPLFMVQGDLDQIAPTAEVAAPPSSDTSILMEYVLRNDNDELEIKEVTRITFYSLDPSFAFSAGIPVGYLRGDLPVMTCGWCGGTYCGCIGCKTSSVYLCCVQGSHFCELTCWPITCSG
jgi:hypothetical protein